MDASTTTTETGPRETVTYILSEVEGPIMETSARLLDWDIPQMKAIGVDTTTDEDGVEFDGMVGMSPTPGGDAELLMDKLFEEGHIDKKIFATYFTNDAFDNHIYFGGYDPDNTNGDYVFTDLLLGYDGHWAVDASDVLYGPKTMDAGLFVGVLDTGTSVTAFPRAIFDEIIEEMKEVNPNCGQRDGIAYICDQCSNPDDFDTITLKLGSAEVEMQPKNWMIVVPGLISSKCYLLIYPHDVEGIASKVALLGDSFMKNYYVLHDMDNKVVGFDGAREITNVRRIVLYVILGLVLLCAVICAFACVCGIVTCILNKSGGSSGKNSNRT